MSPDDYTNSTFFLPVGNGHELWVHDWGSKETETVFFYLHGGPGSQSKDKYKLAFDPTSQRVIFHDQRGSGQSLPYGKLDHNTTQDLASDITKIADRLGVKKFVVTGSSWGSTLALYYAINNPERVSAVVVGGIWAGSRAEDGYMNRGGWRTHFPELWDWYVSTVPKKYQHDPSAYHFEQIKGNDPEKAATSARCFEDMEAGLISLNDRHLKTPAEDYDALGALIEMHYMNNHCFVPDRYVLDNAKSISVPLHIVQGRYDFVCPPVTAYELHKNVPGSTLTWVTSGHASEHETTTAFTLIYQQLSKAVY